MPKDSWSLLTRQILVSLYGELILVPLTEEESCDARIVRKITHQSAKKFASHLFSGEWSDLEVCRAHIPRILIDRKLRIA